MVPSVYIHYWDDVVDIFIDHLCNFIVFAIFCQQHIGIVQTNLTCLDFVSMNISININTRF